MPSCSGNFTEIKGCKFHIGAEPMNWWDAQRYCEERGSRLAELKPHPAWHNALALGLLWPNRNSMYRPHEYVKIHMKRPADRGYSYFHL